MDVATLIVVGLTVFVSWKGFEDRLFLERYKFQIKPLQEGDYIRLISSGFLHVDYTHLLFNMLTLYFFADGIINEYGQVRFVLIYLASIMAGSLLSMFYHKKEAYYSAVGASGAVSGVLFAFILLHPFVKLYLLYIIPIPAIVVGVGYMVYSIYGMKNNVGNIGHTAHLGGAAMGLLMSFIYAPQLLQQKPKVVMLLLIPLVLIFISRKKR